jgi:hypothetical protein
MRQSFLFFILFFAVSIISAQAVYVDERTGITISFKTDGKMFPTSWELYDDPEYRSLPKYDYKRTKNIISKALSKYPVYLLKANLKKIYVLEYLSFDGVGYGGTYTSGSIFIVNEGVLNGYDDLFVEQTFHHEFSSVLYNNYIGRYGDAETVWSICNEGEEYGDGGFNAMKNGTDGLYFDDEINEKGFIYEYARSDKENDYNSLVENIFAPGEGFWDIVEKYPRIKCKVDILLSLYKILDPVFTKEYFMKFEN